MDLIIFFVLILASILISFYYVNEKAEDSARKTIQDYVDGQKMHLQSMLDIQYKCMEAAAKYIGRGDELLSADNMKVIQDLQEVCGFDRTVLMDADGQGTYDNGVEKAAAQTEYFQQAMEGKRALSERVQNTEEGDEWVMLCVQVYHGKEPAGVLGGAYDVEGLSSILLDDIYEDEGLCMIAAVDGMLISIEDNTVFEDAQDDEGLFEVDVRAEFLEGSEDEMKEDFQGKKSGCFKIKKDDELCYLVYEPLEINDWVICYVVPVEKAQESYGFIKQFEALVSVVLAVGILLIFLDTWRISSKQQKNLMISASTDALTGLSNKKHTEEAINHWLAEAPKDTIQVFFMLDLDDFKSINDVYGHPVGDEALRAMGRLLKQEFRDGDIVGRVGGDEFSVLMKNVKDPEVVRCRAEKLYTHLSEVRIQDAEDCRLKCSIGISYFPKDGGSYVELYEHADEALYKAKKGGKNGFVFYT